MASPGCERALPCWRRSCSSGRRSLRHSSSGGQGGGGTQPMRKWRGSSSSSARTQCWADFDPTVLFSRLRQFMEATSRLEGAEVPDEGIAFDKELFAAELQRVMGMTAVPYGGGAQRCLEGSEEDGVSSHTSKVGSSFFTGSDTRDESDDWTQPAGGGGKMPSRAEWQSLAGGGGRDEELWETRTATDSDDDAAFMEGYSRPLDQQLGGTSMGQTFEQAEGVVAKPGTVAAGCAANLASEKGCAVLRPMDVDVNLVSSLLASYRGLGGLPGPTGCLAGLRGATLPDPWAL